MIKLEKSKVAKKIMKKLKKKSKDGIVIIHTKELHYNLLPNGNGSCSVDRYIRFLRQNKYIQYEDPRKNKHYYKIRILKEAK